MKVILDTNFMLIPSQFGVDIFSEIDKKVIEKYEIFVLDKTVYELEKIVKEQKGKHKEAAKIALQFLDRVNVLEGGEGYVDDVIAEIADEHVIVCTQDKELKKRVKEKGARVLTMRQKKYLDFD